MIGNNSVLTSFARLQPRLLKLYGKPIPYSKVWKIISSLPHVYVEYGGGMSHVWHTKKLRDALVVVESIKERTGLESSCFQPIITSVIVKIRVI